MKKISSAPAWANLQQEDGTQEDTASCAHVILFCTSSTAALAMCADLPMPHEWRGKGQKRRGKEREEKKGREKLFVSFHSNAQHNHALLGHILSA
jgi:hypothetical protein